MEEQIKLKEGLPHLYGLKKYGWQKEYCEARVNPRRFLCAANQIGKSTIQICDRIHVATSPELWPKLWPNQFKFNKASMPFSWYLYPNQDTVLSEFYDKWVPYYLPREEFKDHPIYGWKEKVTNRILKCITFNSGWKIYFKTYNQNVHDMQSGTVWAVDCDEELPEELLSELDARLFATRGYFSMAFTATKGQDIWRKAVEGRGDEELFPDAWKRQVSMFDCLKYEDGSETPWTEQRINQIIRNCKSKSEVDKRCFGRFVLDDGLKYQSFTRELNYTRRPKNGRGNPYYGPPKGWAVYGGVDIGSGGKDNHPAAYVLLAVNQAMSKIRVFRCRRMDKIETTAVDILKAYLASSHGLNVVSQAYDFAAKDFGTIAARSGIPFAKAKKDHDIGEMALSTAFKTGMLKIFRGDEEDKLVRELETLLTTTNKRKAKDDLIDALRYALMQVPVDWEKVAGLNDSSSKKEKKSTKQHRRPNEFWEDEEGQSMQDEIDEELQFWDDLY